MSDPGIQKDEATAPEVKDNSKPRSLSRAILIVALILLVGVVAIVIWRAVETPRGEAIAKIVGEGQDKGMLPDDEKQLGLVVKTNYEEYQRNTMNWSVAYFSCLLLSAVFSAFAGFVLKIKAFNTAGVLKEDLAALLATTAALLITLSTVGDFQRRWQANRMAASDAESLAYDLLKTPFGKTERADVISKLQAVATTRNREIVGDKLSGEPAGHKANEGKGQNNADGTDPNKSPTPPGTDSNTNKP